MAILAERVMTIYIICTWASGRRQRFLSSEFFGIFYSY